MLATNQMPETLGRSGCINGEGNRIKIIDLKLWFLSLHWSCWVCWMAVKPTWKLALWWRNHQVKTHHIDYNNLRQANEKDKEQGQIKSLDLTWQQFKAAITCEKGNCVYTCKGNICCTLFSVCFSFFVFIFTFTLRIVLINGTICLDSTQDTICHCISVHGT